MPTNSDYTKILLANVNVNSLGNILSAYAQTSTGHALYTNSGNTFKFFSGVDIVAGPTFNKIFDTTVSCTFVNSSKAAIVYTGTTAGVTGTATASNLDSTIAIGSFGISTSNNYIGYISEVMIFPSAFSSTDISTVVGNHKAYYYPSRGVLGNYYNTSNSLSLNKIGLNNSSSPSSAAFSLRQLSSTYTGKAVNVRRSSDTTTQDIGFTANGDLDTAALKTFVGNGNGYVVTWYDQSGNGRNATQPTVAKQPQIVTGGVVYRSLSGKPTVYFGGSNYLSTVSGMPTDITNSPYTVATVLTQVSSTSSPGSPGIYFGTAATNSVALWFSTSTFPRINDAGGAIGPSLPLNTEGAITSIKNIAYPNKAQVYVNGVTGSVNTSVFSVNKDSTMLLGGIPGVVISLVIYQK